MRPACSLTRGLLRIPCFTTVFLLSGGILLSASRSAQDIPTQRSWQFRKVGTSKDPSYIADIPGYRFRANNGGFEFGHPADLSHSARWSWVGGRQQIVPEGIEIGSAKTNYLLGNKTKDWQVGVRTYEKVRFRNVWPGIDAFLYGSDARFEYDFVVEPGANPNLIRIKADGIAGVDPKSDSILFQSPGGPFRQLAAVLYQTIKGKRVSVEGKYRITPEGFIGIEVGHYDRNQSLTIDPVITYSLQYGGNGAESISGMARDAMGNIYLSGTSSSSSLQGLGAKQNGQGGSDAFIRKISPNGKVIYSTFLGGSGEDQATAVAIDNQGNVFLAGWTSSLNFPTRNPVQSALRGSRNGFLAKLNSDGSVIFCT